MPLTKAIRDALVADATLVALLSSYDPPGAEGPSPAIFTDPIPEGAQAPFVVLSGEVSQEPLLDDNSNGLGSEVLYDVRCYTAQGGSRVLVKQIANRIRALLHRQPLTIAGFAWVDTRVSGPIVGDEVDLYGRVLTARVLVDG